MATKTEAREPSPSCTLTHGGVSLVLYGLSREDVIATPMIALYMFSRRGVDVENPEDVRVLAGRRVPAGLPPHLWRRRRGEPEHFCLNGRGAR